MRERASLRQLNLNTQEINDILTLKFYHHRTYSPQNIFGFDGMKFINELGQIKFLPSYSKSVNDITQSKQSLCYYHTICLIL